MKIKLNAAQRILTAASSDPQPQEYKEGYAAREAGTKVSEVPYTEASSKTKWKIGWYDADDDIDARLGYVK